MSDLIEKYFKEDLTEAEKAELRQELLTNEDAARRLGEKAEEVYRRFGLPEPRWTGPEELPGRDGLGWKPYLWLGIFLTLIAGFGAWFLHRMLQAEQNLSAPAAQTHSPIRVVQPEEQYAQVPPAVPTPLVVPSPKAFQSPTQDAAAPTEAPMSPFIPKFTPVNSDLGSQKPYSSLSVALHRSKQGFLKVRVLDAQKNEIVPLFQGNLGPGNWTFEWDGRLRNGQMAGPGLYKIEISAGKWVQTKEVQIQK